MKKLLTILLLFSIFSSIYAQDSIALALKVKGDVNLTRSESEDKLELGDSLINQDVLISKDDSFAAVRFIDGSALVKLFSNSRLIINADKKTDKYDKKSYLKMGSLWTKVTTNSGSFDVETPTTVVSVRGTEFIVEIDDDGNTRVYAISGKVAVKNKKSGQEVVLGAGQSTQDDNNNPMQVGNIDWDEVPGDAGDEVGNPQVLQLELENGDGEKRAVEIKFE